jgi:predicted MPP superfamily phosphohydrolase
MLPEERMRIGIAAAVVLLVCGASLAFAARSAMAWVRRRQGRPMGPLGLPMRRARAVTYALAGIGLVCAAYARFVEPYWPEVTRARVESAKLAPGSRPIRIAHISDVHSDPEARLEPRLPEIIAREKPDLIVFTGDAVNSPGGLANFRALMTRLAAVAPTYAVRGNWDVWYWSQLDLFGGTGVTELDGTAVRVPAPSLPGEPWVGGVAVGHLDAVPGTLRSIPTGAFSIFLYHYPDEIEEVARHGADLYCAGHTHGGQVALPFYGALVTLSGFGKRFEGGHYRVGHTDLHVNRGIGMEGGSAPRVRFMARPEITIIEVHPARPRP